jgi:hypothetical protein
MPGSDSLAALQLHAQGCARGKNRGELLISNY